MAAIFLLLIIYFCAHALSTSGYYKARDFKYGRRNWKPGLNRNQFIYPFDLAFMGGIHPEKSVASFRSLNDWVFEQNRYPFILQDNEKSVYSYYKTIHRDLRKPFVGFKYGSSGASIHNAVLPINKENGNAARVDPWPVPFQEKNANDKFLYRPLHLKMKKRIGDFVQIAEGQVIPLGTDFKTRADMRRPLDHKVQVHPPEINLLKTSSPKKSGLDKFKIMELHFSSVDDPAPRIKLRETLGPEFYFNTSVVLPQPPNTDTSKLLLIKSHLPPTNGDTSHDTITGSNNDMPSGIPLNDLPNTRDPTSVVTINGPEFTNDNGTFVSIPGGGTDPSIHRASNTPVDTHDLSNHVSNTGTWLSETPQELIPSSHDLQIGLTSIGVDPGADPLVVDLASNSTHGANGVELGSQSDTGITVIDLLSGSIGGIDQINFEHNDGFTPVQGKGSSGTVSEDFGNLAFAPPIAGVQFANAMLPSSLTGPGTHFTSLNRDGKGDTTGLGVGSQVVLESNGGNPRAPLDNLVHPGDSNILVSFPVVDVSKFLAIDNYFDGVSVESNRDALTNTGSLKPLQPIHQAGLNDLGLTVGGGIGGKLPNITIRLNADVGVAENVKPSEDGHESDIHSSPLPYMKYLESFGPGPYGNCRVPARVVCGARYEWNQVFGMNDWCRRNCVVYMYSTYCDDQRCICVCTAT